MSCNGCSLVWSESQSKKKKKIRSSNFLVTGIISCACFFLIYRNILTTTILEATVFHKESNNDIYLHRGSFAPIAWKKRTLTTLIRRAYTVWSNGNFLQEQLDHIET